MAIQQPILPTALGNQASIAQENQVNPSAMGTQPTLSSPQALGAAASQPSYQPYGNLGQMQTDWNNFWANPNQNITGNGYTVNHNTNGTATFTDANGNYTLNPTQSFSDVAHGNQDIANIWANNYGYRAPTTVGDVAKQIAPYKASVDTSALSGLGNTAQGNYNNFTNRIQGYYNDPSSFKLNPAYQSQYNLGLDAVSRQQAALGGYGSGNALYALDKYGNDLANQAWNSEIQNLGTLANQNGQLANSAFGQAANVQGNVAAANNNLLGNIYNSTLSNQIAQQNANTAGQAGMWNAYTGLLGTQGNLANQAYQSGANAWGQDFNNLGALSGLNMNGGGQINAGGVPTALGSQGASNNALGQILQYLGQNGIGSLGNMSF